MKKRKLIILIGSLVLISSIVVALAAFVFHKVVTTTANTGTIEADEMYFNVYQIDEEANDYTLTEDFEEKEAKGKSITCYATKKQGWSAETEDCYLNQISLKFTYTTTIAVYVRVHIQDAWISTKTYTNGIVNKSYIEKDKINGKSPFEPQDKTNWVYDEATNCIYYKTMVTLEEASGTTTTKVSSKTVTQEFKLDSSYFYDATTSTSYREHVTVQVSYYVDIVQANRAEKKWQVDFDKLGLN